MTIHLSLNYKVPSLNVTKRQHWAAQMAEKRKAQSALLSALSDTAADPSIPITLRAAAKTSWTHLGTHISLRGMNRGKSSSRRSRSKYRIKLTKKQRLKLGIRE